MQNKTKRTQMNLFLDFALIIAFLVVLQPSHTGLLIHEWLGLALGGATAVHMILHWQWIVAITQKLFGKLPFKTRLYYVLDAALLAAFFVILISGVLLSEIALPIFNLRGTTWQIFGSLHEYVSYLALALLAVKLALHWKWITHAVKQYVSGGTRTLSQPAAAPSTTPTLTPVTQADFKGPISRRRFLVVGCSAVCVVALAGTCAHLREQGIDDAEAANKTESPVNPEATDAQQLTSDTNVATVATATATQPPTSDTNLATATAETGAYSTPVATPTNAPQPIETRCPHGLVNDPYPGHCRRYTDQNGNNICDLSETA